jgi:nicotinamidase-related amidase
MEQLPEHAVLLIVDVQKGFDEPTWGSRNNPGAELNIARLLAAWRKTSRPVFHVQHLSLSPLSPLHATKPGSAIKDAVKPQGGELLFQKHVNSAFIGTGLEQKLRERGYDSLVIVGLTTPHCVSTTTRMAGNLGFRTFVVSDATAAFDIVGHDGRRYPAEELHAVSLATLHDEFATVVESEELLRALQQG